VQIQKKNVYEIIQLLNYERVMNVRKTSFVFYKAVVDIRLTFN